MDWGTFFDSKAGSNAVGSLAGGLGKGLGDAIGGANRPPVISGGPADSRSFMDGSGWTVSTGSSRASGAAIQQRDGFGASVVQPPALSGFGGGLGGMPASGGVAMAGLGSNPLLLLMILGMVAVAWRNR